MIGHQQQQQQIEQDYQPSNMQQNLQQPNTLNLCTDQLPHTNPPLLSSTSMPLPMTYSQVDSSNNGLESSVFPSPTVPSSLLSPLSSALNQMPFSPFVHRRSDPNPFSISPDPLIASSFLSSSTLASSPRFPLSSLSPSSLNRSWSNDTVAGGAAAVDFAFADKNEWNSSTAQQAQNQSTHSLSNPPISAPFPSSISPLPSHATMPPYIPLSLPSSSQNEITPKPDSPSTKSTSSESDDSIIDIPRSSHTRAHTRQYQHNPPFAFATYQSEPSPIPSFPSFSPSRSLAPAPPSDLSTVVCRHFRRFDLCGSPRPYESDYLSAVQPFFRDGSLISLVRAQLNNYVSGNLSFAASQAFQRMLAGMFEVAMHTGQETVAAFFNEMMPTGTRQRAAFLARTQARLTERGDHASLSSCGELQLEVNSAMRRQHENDCACIQCIERTWSSGNILLRFRTFLVCVLLLLNHFLWRASDVIVSCISFCFLLSLLSLS